MSNPIMERYIKIKVGESSPKTFEYVDMDTLLSDPADRKPISSVSQRDEIRRTYILRGLCESRGIDFPQSMCYGNELRRYIESWYGTYEYNVMVRVYSVRSDCVFCLCCYLFTGTFGDH
ncbi:hypothetical protein HanPI659440_Chr13g0494521 [Helianthus annuus]|nr:hypothetical protein HanPI659440_Chr13g0494521 [Helianthus annuus]